MTVDEYIYIEENEDSIALESQGGMDYEPGSQTEKATAYHKMNMLRTAKSAEVLQYAADWKEAPGNKKAIRTFGKWSLRYLIG